MNRNMLISCAAGVFLLSAAGVAAQPADVPAWQVRGLPADLQPPPAESAVRWIWHGGAQHDDTDAWFRYAFDLAAAPTNGSVKVSADDAGEYWINGAPVKPAAIVRGLRAGRNVLAVHVKNIYSSGGLIMTGDIRLADGSAFSLRTTAAFRVSETQPAAGWQAPDFDDRRWAPATELGDVWLKTFARYRDFAKDFATPAERAAHAARVERISAKTRARSAAAYRVAAAEPEPDCRIVYRGFRPFVSVNGELLEPDFALYPMSDVWEASVVRKMRSLGVRIFRLAMRREEFEKKAGEYAFDDLDRQMRRLIEEVPDALVCVQMLLDLPKWCAAHPAELIGYADGPIDTKAGDERLLRQPRPSAASAAYRAELKRLIAAFGAYVKRQPWHGRVVMLRPCWGIYTEWHTYGMYHAPDVGPAMTAAFRRFANGRYAGENPPGVAERTHAATLLDPRADRKVIDYYACMAGEVADLLTFCCGELKRALPGRLAGAYYGYVFAMHPPEGANVLLDRVLASPAVDYLSNPANYSVLSRRAGGSYYERTVPAVFHRYGKLPIIEDDMRFHHISNSCETAICTATPRESRVTARRNYLNKLFDGAGIQFLDPMRQRGTRPYNFDDPDVLAGVREGMAAARKAGLQNVSSRNALAVVVSARERLLRDGAPGASAANSGIYAHAPHELYRAGVTFDLLELADYLKDPAPYRQVVFLNAFTLTAAEREGLRAATSRAGVNALWLVAPGAGTEGGFSDAAMSALAGLALAGAGREPSVTCTDPAARKTPWGGFSRVRADGGKTFFLATVPRGIGAWRRVLGDLGAHVWTAQDAYVRHHDGLILYHTATAGAHALALPPELRGCAFTELVGGTAHAAAEKLSFATTGADTLLFQARPRAAGDR